MPLDPSPVPEPSPPWRTTIGLALLSAAGLLAFRIPHLRDALSPDEALYLLQAGVIKRGGLPYRDLWDSHAPGLFFLVALLPAALLKAGAAVRLVSVAALGAGALLGIRLLQRARVGGWAILTGLALYTAANCLDVFESDFFETEQVLVPLLLGMMLVLHCRRRPALAWGLWGLMTVFKQTAVLFLPLLLVADLGDAHRRSGLSLKNAAWRSIAAAAPWLAVLLYFALLGGLRELFQGVIFDALGYRAIHGSGQAWYRPGQFFSLRLWLWLLLPALALLFFARKDIAHRWRLTLAALLLLLSGALYIRLQGFGFPHYSSILTPALLLLGAIGMQQYLDLAGSGAGLRQKIFLAAWPLAFLWATLQPAQQTRDNRYPNLMWNFHSFQVRELAQAIRRDLPAMRIYSMEMHPGWYWYSGQTPPREVWVPFRLSGFQGRRDAVERSLAAYGADAPLLLIYRRPDWMAPNPALDEFQAALRARGAQPFPLAEKLPGVAVPPEFSADVMDLRAADPGARR